MNKNIFKYIVLIGLFIVPFVPFMVSSSFFFPFITTKAFAWRIIVEIVFASWIILAALSPEYRPRKSIILYSLFAFIFIIGLADVFGVSPLKSFWSNFERMEGFITLLHLGAFFLVIGSVFKDREWRWWWNTSLTASFLMVLYCLAQVLGVATIHQGGVRLDGTFGNAAYLAVYMLFHIFIALLYFVREKRGSSTRWIYGVLIFGQIYILYLTATRGSILGLIGGVIIVALLNIRNKHSKYLRKVSIAVLVGMLALGGGFYLLRNSNFVNKSPVLSRFSSISVSEIKTEGRSFVWPIAIQGIKEKPFLGWGQDNFNYVFNEHYDPKMFNLEPWFDRAHNIFLDWGIAGGLLGLLGYLSLYGALIYSVWKKGNSLPYIERSLITGLLAAYFFHNLFVFDQIISYILFISLLAYVHSKNSLPIKKISEKNISENNIVAYVIAPVFIALCFVVYTVNISPIKTNLSLIKGLQVVQSEASNKGGTLKYFTEAYDGSYLGRSETVEWIGTAATSILSSSISNEDKNKYISFANKVVEKQAEDFSTDTRYQIMAGSYFARTGHPDEAITYLERAKALTPGKQIIYFELGASYIDKKDYSKALSVFKEAYDLAPEYKESKIIYLIGAIYAGDEKLEQSLSSELTKEEIANDPRIASALLSAGRLEELENVLITNLELHPDDQQAYLSLAGVYLREGDKVNAIKILESLGETLPQSKNISDQYIKGIKEGTIK